jgi:hypothetical protein
MKTYQRITSSTQVKENDVLVDFCYEGKVWHTFTVGEVTAGGVYLVCPSRAYVFRSNEKLATDSKYFKRV